MSGRRPADLQVLSCCVGQEFRIRQGRVEGRAQRIGELEGRALNGIEGDVRGCRVLTANYCLKRTTSGAG